MPPLPKATAVFWIRDGVLIDRMPVNAVAFAVACLSHATIAPASQPPLASLINFAFQTSGISAADKMRRYNDQHERLVPDVEAAAQYYNELATAAGARCAYFDGVCELLKNLHEQHCVLNFITSAVEQSVLDEWLTSDQGKLIAPYLTETLGERGDNFRKGEPHFAYVKERFEVARIIYVADALSELTTGTQFAQQFNIINIGFANAPTATTIRHAFDLVMIAHHHRLSNTNFQLNESQLELPTTNEIADTMRNYAKLIAHPHAPPTIDTQIRTALNQ
jgi:phosphoglycolate phosphatase-like HAD superfamily hydrolase